MIIPNLWKVIKFMFQTTNQLLFCSSFIEKNVGKPHLGHPAFCTLSYPSSCSTQTEKGHFGWRNPWKSVEISIFNDYPLVNIQKTMENHNFSWEKLTISMAIFNSYVKLPEGKSC